MDLLKEIEQINVKIKELTEKALTGYKEGKFCMTACDTDREINLLIKQLDSNCMTQRTEDFNNDVLNAKEHREIRSNNDLKSQDLYEKDIVSALDYREYSKKEIESAAEHRKAVIKHMDSVEKHNAKIEDLFSDLVYVLQKMEKK